jgi:hypothetical protein
MSVESNQIVSNTTTCQLKLSPELPLINDPTAGAADAHPMRQPPDDTPTTTEESDIPLPHEDALVEVQFPRLVDRLIKHNIIDESNKVEWMSATVSKGAAVQYIMRQWKKNDMAGRRWVDGPKCYSPDQAMFPGATTTPFRLDNF